MKRFKNILFVVDEQSAHEQALDRVIWLSKANGARVTVAGTIDSGGSHGLSDAFSIIPGLAPKDIEQRILRVHQRKLDETAKVLSDRGVHVDTKLLVGTPFIELIRQVMRDKHDLVIKGAYRSAGNAFFPGGDMHLLRKCPCPVWVLNSVSEPKAQRILVAVDPDFDDAPRYELNRMILALATSLARQDGAKLDVVNVWRLQEEAALRHSLAKIPEESINRMVATEKTNSEARLQRLVAEFSEFDDIMRVLHIKGMAADVIPEHVKAESIDTLVMGTLARTGVAGLFIGNTAETILNHVTCSVLTVKAKGFVSPVELEGATS
jgi:nucleotide-binding universal stress UspA family protein